MPTGEIYAWERIKKHAQESNLVIHIRADGYQVQFPDGHSTQLIRDLDVVGLVVEAFERGWRSAPREG